MKIETKKIVEFLNKIKMSGTQLVSECIFKFEKNGLNIITNSLANQSRIAGILKSTAFKEYEEIDSIGINQLSEFTTVIKRFVGEVTLKVEGNIINIKGKSKKVDVELVDTSFISTEIKEPVLEFIDTFSIPAKKLKEIFEDVKINDDSEMTFETEEGKVKFSNTGKYKFQHAFESKTCNGGAKSKFGEPFIDSISELTGLLEISLGVDYPIKVIEKTEDSVITVISAPRVKEE